MEFRCKKERGVNVLNYEIEFSEEYIDRIKRYSHEIKCFLLNQEDKYLDTNDYIFCEDSFEEFSNKGSFIFDFMYYNRQAPSLFLNFSITFTRDNIFEINHIFFKNIADDRFIKRKADKTFRYKTGKHILDILDLIINRNDQGFYCGTCVYKHQYASSRQCLHIYRKIKI